MMRFLRSQEPIMLQGNIWSKSTFLMSEWVGCFHSLLKFSEQCSKCSTVYDQSLSSAKQRPNYHFLLFSKSQTRMQCSYTIYSQFRLWWSLLLFIHFISSLWKQHFLHLSFSGHFWWHYWTDIIFCCENKCRFTLIQQLKVDLVCTGFGWVL